MTPRIDAARIAARILLKRLWSKSTDKEPRLILDRSLELAATDLKIIIDHVPSILGDNQIAGIFNRNERTIQVATKFSPSSQRFTCAHEIGHFILHPGQLYFRDRELSAPDAPREYFEIEADSFAAEFLMPRKFLNPVFSDMFGGPIDGTMLDPRLEWSFQGSKKADSKLTPQEFVSLTPLRRAAAIAMVYTYKGRFFAPLTDQFKVSEMAMGIQLLQMGLVK